MGFSPDQLEQLTADLDRANVKERDGLSYIEGWHAIAEANRIFGFDKWDRETVLLHPVDEGVTTKGTEYVCYLAKVKVTVRAGLEHPITREGTGYGTGYGNDKHEGAAKEAETDAMKRALMTFGNPFGLALYDKAQEHVTGEKNGRPNTNGKKPSHNLTRDILEAAEAAYGDAKNKKLSQLTKELTKGRTSLVKDLKPQEAQYLLDGIKARVEQT